MTPRKSALMWRLVLPVAIAILPLALTPLAAQNAARTPDDILKAESYQMPPRELADAVLAPRYQNVTLTNASPDKKWFLDEIGDGPVVMKTFSKPFHELGGLFIDFKANRARPLTVRNNIGIQVISAADGSKKLIQLPAGARVSNAAWSPDSKSVAFYLHGEDATHLWMADAATGQARQVTKTPMLATLVSTFDFTKDGKQIAAVVIPDTRTAMPQEPVSPPGPSVKLALDTDKNRLRTFPEPDVDAVPGAAPRMAHDRAARADRRRQGDREARRIAGDDPRHRPRARRQVRPRDPHAEAVLLRRAGLQLRVDRGDLGRQRQGAREDQRPSDEPRRRRTTRSLRPIPGAGRGGRRRPRRLADRQARSRVAHRRPGAHIRRG